MREINGQGTFSADSGRAGIDGGRDPMKFRNGDVSLDRAVECIINSGKKFTVPNSDLLVQAVMDTPLVT